MWSHAQARILVKKEHGKIEKGELHVQLRPLHLTTALYSGGRHKDDDDNVSKAEIQRRLDWVRHIFAGVFKLDLRDPNENKERWEKALSSTRWWTPTSFVREEEHPWKVPNPSRWDKASQEERDSFEQELLEKFGDLASNGTEKQLEDIWKRPTARQMELAYLDMVPLFPGVPGPLFSTPPREENEEQFEAFMRDRRLQEQDTVVILGKPTGRQGPASVETSSP